MGSGPPLFWSGMTDPHFISTPSRKFCLVSTFQTKVTPLCDMLYFIVDMIARSLPTFGITLPLSLLSSWSLVSLCLTVSLIQFSNSAKQFIIPAKAREYVFTDVGLCVCVCL